MATFNVLFFGDVVGRPGRTALNVALPALKQKFGGNFIVVNGENAASGSGLTRPTLDKIMSCGANVVTSGDHIFRNKEFVDIINEPYLLRPANYPKAADGNGGQILPLSPVDFAALQASDTAMWARVVKAAGMQPE